MANVNVYFLSFRNYYNRRIENRGDTVSNYSWFILGSVNNANFNPNDGVDTTFVINYGGERIPDYLLVADNEDKIISRWFVMEASRTRGGQFSIKLHRDLIADFQKQILTSDCMIDRGWVYPNNNLIFNSEGMTYNQIKKDEILLKNNLGTPWVVAYLSRTNAAGEPITYSGSFGFNVESITVDFNTTTLAAFSPRIILYSIRVPKTVSFLAYYVYNDNIYCVKFSNQGISDTYVSHVTPATANLPTRNERFNTLSQEDAYYYMLEKYNDSFIQDSDGYMVNAYTNNEMTSESYFNEYKNDYAGKVIHCTEAPASYESNYFTINYKKDQTASQHKTYTLTSQSSLVRYISNVVYDEEISQSALNLGAITIYCQNIEVYDINPYPLIPGQHNYSFTYNSSVTRDASYEIIATPMESMDFEVESGGSIKTIRHNGSLGFEWFQNIARKYYESGACYDVQIVPYIDFDSNILTGQSYISIKDINDNDIAIALQIKSSSFSKNITLTNIPGVHETKLASEVDLYRLVSPNGVGQFDFSIVKNGGLDTVEVDVTLIPINPYIKINPKFGRLYGGDFNDFRGLICGGDFSAPIVSSQWETYQINNKYYQQVFDRETQTLDLQNKYAYVNDTINAALGVGSGMASGAMMGSMISPGTGTLAGGIAGGVVSAAAGLADVFINDKLRRESMSLREDQFVANLQTIQARPSTLTRSTAYNINNKYFPYIEYYSCSDEELEAISRKIHYTSMRVGVIGEIRDYLNPYIDYTFIQARPVILEGLGDDYHTALEIAKELQQGVYIYSEDFYDDD